MKLRNYLFYIFLFLLPWQTRWIFAEFQINGQGWEYGKLSIYAVEVLLVLVTFLRRLKISVSRRKFLSYVQLVLGACLISFLQTIDPILSLGMLLHLVAAAVLFVVFLNDDLPTTPAILALVGGLLLPAALGWFQVLTGESPASTWFGLATHQAATLGASVVETRGERFLRAYGSFSHPNVFGGYLAMAIILLGYLAAKIKSRARRIIVCLLVAALVSTLVITFSRGALLATAIGVLTIIALRLWTRKTLPRLALPAISVGCLALLVTLIAFHQPAFARTDPRLRLEAKSISQRWSDYRVFGEVFLTGPITGIGLGTYTKALSIIRSGEPVWSFQPIHNTYLLILAELGVLGALVVTYALSKLIRAIVVSRNSGEGIVAIGLLSTLAVLAFFDHYLWSSWSGLALSAFVFAISLRLSRTG